MGVETFNWSADVDEQALLIETVPLQVGVAIVGDHTFSSSSTLSDNGVDLLLAGVTNAA
jgi:hypothetical protein